jgi:hypothetical protein
MHGEVALERVVVFIGFLIGVLVVCLIGVMVIVYQGPRQAADFSAAAVSPQVNTANPTLQPTATSLLQVINTSILDTPIPAATILDQAETHLYSDPEKVLDLLVPVVKDLSDLDDRVLAYRYLGDAETYLGRNKLAVVYYEEMRKYQPSVENLLLVAETYYVAGDIECALARYTELSQWQGEDAAYYQEIGNSWVEHLLEILDDCYTPCNK